MTLLKAMETQTQAASSVQFSRTQEAGWRDTSHGLVHGFTVQTPAAPIATAGGEMRSASAKMPAWEQPLTTLLSAPLSPAKSQQAVPMRRRPLNTAGYSLASATSAAGSGGTSGRHCAGIPRHLRDRVASTRTLPDNLRTECLERLERIDKEIPLKLRHRPSWTHLQDNLESEESKAMSSVAEVDEGGADANAFDKAEIPGMELAPSMASEIPALQLPVNRSAAFVGPVVRTGAVPQARQRRKRQVWAVENYDLTNAASVWKTSTKGIATSYSGIASPGKASDRSLQNGQASPQLGSAQSAPVLRALTAPAVGTERTRRAIAEVKARMGDMANSPSNATNDSGNGQAGSAEVCSVPAARGVKSLLRTTLRYALQH